VTATATSNAAVPKTTDALPILERDIVRPNV
jgi:hypothetical protein